MFVTTNLSEQIHPQSSNLFLDSWRGNVTNLSEQIHPQSSNPFLDSWRGSVICSLLLLRLDGRVHGKQ